LVVGVFVRWLFFGPGIAKSQPGKSGRKGGGGIRAKIFKVGLEFIAIHGRGGARLHVTGLIVGVNKAFSTYVPAEAHAGAFVPLGAIPYAFSRRIALPNLAFFNKEIDDGDGVFDDVFPFTSSDFLFFPPVRFPSSPGKNIGYCCWIFGRGPDKIGRKYHVERTVEDHLEDLVKTSKAVIDH
jgi:hypothetical protein